MVVHILGGAGHARVIADAISHEVNYSMIGEEIPPGSLIAIGVGDLNKRRELFEAYSETHQIVPAVHLSAIVGHGVRWGKGVQIMAGVIIQQGVQIGDNVLINTKASIDHGCKIGSHTHIAPGATLCGDVEIGEGSFIGAGSTIIQGVTLDAGTKIPAGSLVCGSGDIRCASRMVRNH